MSGGSYSATYFLLCGIALLSMFSTSLIIPLIPIYAKQIGATGVVIGFSVAAYWISRIVMEIPSGFVSQRFGYYRSMAVGLGLNVVGTALCAYAVNPIQFVLARALMGIGAPLFFAVATTFVLNLFDAERRGGAMGIFQGIEFAGTIVGSTFSGYVVSVFDFRVSFIFSAGLILIALVLVVVPPHIRSESGRMTASSGLSLSAMRDESPFSGRPNIRGYLFAANASARIKNALLVIFTPNDLLSFSLRAISSVTSAFDSI